MWKYTPMAQHQGVDPYGPVVVGPPHICSVSGGATYLFITFTFEPQETISQDTDSFTYFLHNQCVL